MDPWLSVLYRDMDNAKTLLKHTEISFFVDSPLVVKWVLLYLGDVGLWSQTRSMEDICHHRIVAAIDNIVAW